MSLVWLPLPSYSRVLVRNYNDSGFPLSTSELFDAIILSLNLLGDSFCFSPLAISAAYFFTMKRRQQRHDIDCRMTLAVW